MALLLGSCLTVVPESEHRPLSRRMSAPGLTSEAQLRYILQWFGEFSELQREDFLPVLAAARGDKPEQLATSLASISCHDKPVSLFQCRIKLFNEWFPTWSEEEQDRLIKGVSDADPEFGTKLLDLLKNETPVNGDNFDTIELNGTSEQNGTSELHSPPPEEIKIDEIETDVDEKENIENNVDIVIEEEQESEEGPVESENVPEEITAAVSENVSLEITAAS